MNGILRAFLLATLTIALSACASFTPPLSPAAAPSSGTGYIYGRFTLKDTTTGIGHLRMGLELSGPQAYTFQFEREHDLVVIAVPAGSYSISKLVFATYDYGKAGERPIVDPRLSAPFAVESGKAYYIGDYVAESGGRASGLQINQSWRLSSIRDSFEDTTAQFKLKFPLLKGLDIKRAPAIEGAR
jgi:hypothetical protein